MNIQEAADAALMSLDLELNHQLNEWNCEKMPQKREPEPVCPK